MEERRPKVKLGVGAALIRNLVQARLWDPVLALPLLVLLGVFRAFSVELQSTA